VVHAESVLELRRISAAAAVRGEQVAVALRVNPARTQLQGALAMGGRPSPFGLAEPDVPAALEVARSLPGLDVVGFHVHAVCGNRDAAAHARYVAWCLEFASATAAAHGVELRWVDVGGGLGVDYDGAGALDLDLFGAALAELRPPAGVEVVFEPGRWIAADCGWYVAEVVDCKTSYGRAYAVVRGGINGFALPPTEDFPFPVAVLPVEDWPEGLERPELRGEITVAGELCTPEDVLVRDVRVSRVRAGDLLVFPRAGAYGWEFSLQQFLGHPAPTRELLGPLPVALDLLPHQVPDPLPAL
jgi:2-[(L-alanin-3-ylcarbamoyl)methyl]-2-hydroxybutanedioate decarboxylase